jgi:hypothetical protein
VRVILLPVWIVQTSSVPKEVIQIAAAPDAARYCSARFRFGDFASMGNVDSRIGGRRHGKKPRGRRCWLRQADAALIGVVVMLTDLNGDVFGSPLEEVTKIREPISAEGVNILDGAIAIEPPRSVSSHSNKVNFAEGLFSGTVVRGFPLWAKHQDAGIGVPHGADGKVEVVGDRVRQNGCDRDCLHFVGRGLASIHVPQVRDKAAMGFILLLEALAFDDYIGSQLPLGGVLSSVH